MDDVERMERSRSPEHILFRVEALLKRPNPVWAAHAALRHLVLDPHGGWSAHPRANPHDAATCSALKKDRLDLDAARTAVGQIRRSGAWPTGLADRISSLLDEVGRVRRGGYWTAQLRLDPAEPVTNRDLADLSAIGSIRNLAAFPSEGPGPHGAWALRMEAFGLLVLDPQYRDDLESFHTAEMLPTEPCLALLKLWFDRTAI